MIKPKFFLTPKLFSLISSIERVYGQIEALKVPKELELDIRQSNMIKSSWASNRIEGNPLTLPEVTNLLLDARMPVSRSEKEVVNYFGILGSLEKYFDDPFTIKLILNFHKNLLDGVDKTGGEVRNTMVVVGKYREEKGNVSLKVKHNPPFHEKNKILEALNELFEYFEKDTDTHPVVKSAVLHHHFVYIHPFEDGNGRAARILTALALSKSGYLINRYFILDDYYDLDRLAYSDMLHSADSGDKTRWIEYFAEGMANSLKAAHAKFYNAVKYLKFDQKPTPKETEVLKYIEKFKEVTSQDIAGELKVTRQQSHHLLRSLVNKGILDKKGSTKSSHYFIK